MIFKAKDRVKTPYGVGSIIYTRMAAPNYNEVAAYSVCLDSKLNASRLPPFPFYNGTMCSPEEVEVEN
jgi:hypothetical protein